MIYSFSLQTVGLAVGLLLIALHLFALVNARESKQFLRVFPRSPWIGQALLIIDAIWSFALISTMDLGEFSSFKNAILIAIVVAAILTILYVEEFLAVRALGIFCLLAAEPLVEAAFLQPQTSRLLLTLLAYAWATLGMFWVGMPYLLRNQISWVSQTDRRWRAAAFGGIAYGAILSFCALFFWG